MTLDTEYFSRLVAAEAAAERAGFQHTATVLRDLIEQSLQQRSAPLPGMQTSTSNRQFMDFSVDVNAELTKRTPS